MKDLVVKLLFILLAVLAVLTGIVLALAVTRYANAAIGRWAGTVFAVSVGVASVLALIIFVQMWRDGR